MSVIFNEKTKTFKLDTPSSTYAFEIHDGGYLVHLYYGSKLPDDGLKHLSFRHASASFSPMNPRVTDGFNPDCWLMEYPCNGTGDMRISALAVKNADGNASTDMRYVSHEIYPGKPALEGLPATYVNDPGEATTLEVTCADPATGIRAVLLYTVFEDIDVITRSVRIENASERPCDIQRVMSCCVDLPGMEYKMSHLYGRWLKERTLATRDLEHGLQGIQSKRGSSSHNHNPFVAIADKDATEERGGVYGFNFVYSGNFLADVEVDFDDDSRFIMGINPTDFSWHLDPGERFVAPEVVMVRTDGGYGEMSRIFHRFYNNNLVRGKWKNAKRPLLVNSWEGCYFDFDDDKLVSFAERAKELGFEMLVMDDGWFGVRNDDTTSLGDWFVNEKKLKGGLAPLIKRVKALGLKFGIWFEPEMISPDSELFRAHPDWHVHCAGRECSQGRQQYVIDMTRKDVRDCIFEQMDAVLAGNDIDYLKWDYNRNISEAGSALLPPERQQEFFHRFILGTYELMGRLTEAYPDMLIENCSGGGGRFDPGMLFFSPQIWTSDNTDPIERLSIQFGTSMCYPVSTMGAHVSANRRTGYETKANVAMCGTFGYELDPNKLSDDVKALIREQVADYHKYYELIHYGDLYRLISPDFDRYRCAWGNVSPDKSEALYTFVIMRRAPQQTWLVRLKGLDPDKYYRDSETGEVHSGALLMNAGLNLTCRPNEDGASFTIHVIEEK